MKTVIAHFKKFPEPYRSQAIANTPPGILNSKEPDAKEALKGSFVWDNSAQGIKYWSDFYQTIGKRKIYWIPISISAFALAASLAYAYYLIPLASLALAISLEKSFGFPKFKRRRSLRYYSKLLQGRYGTHAVYIAISLHNSNYYWHAIVNNISGNGSSFEELVENLDKNLVIYESCDKSLRSNSIVFLFTSVQCHVFMSFCH